MPGLSNGEDPKIAERLKAVPPIRLAQIPAGATPGHDGDKASAKKAEEPRGERLAELQGLLYANGRTGGAAALLLVLQGMDTSGKSGAIRAIGHHTNPLGVRVAAFGRPTAEELEHDFLWRIRRELPKPGEIVIFDRSHYEDVVAAVVRGEIGAEECSRRYGAINEFEQEIAQDGVSVVKCFLHISSDEQRERLLARLDRPDKQWKFDPTDLDDRAKWDEFIDAYERAMERCASAEAPWHIVPADHKWYRDWALAGVLIERLSALDLSWPDPDFDLVEARRALTGS